MEPEELAVITFTAHDRCDRCGVQALAVAKKEGFEDLLFCWHDKTKHGSALLDQGWEVIEDYATYESYKPLHMRTAQTV